MSSTEEEEVYYHHPPDDPDRQCGPMVRVEEPVPFGEDPIDVTHLDEETRAALTWLRCRSCGMAIAIEDLDDEEDDEDGDDVQGT